MRIIKKLLMVFCLFMVCASGTEAAMSSTLPQNEMQSMAHLLVHAKNAQPICYGHCVIQRLRLS